MSLWWTFWVCCDRTHSTNSQKLSTVMYTCEYRDVRTRCWEISALKMHTSCFFSGLNIISGFGCDHCSLQRQNISLMLEENCVCVFLGTLENAWGGDDSFCFTQEMQINHKCESAHARSVWWSKQQYPSAQRRSAAWVEMTTETIVI